LVESEYGQLWIAKRSSKVIMSVSPQFVTELVDGIRRVMGTALSFLQRLAEMQVR